MGISSSASCLVLACLSLLQPTAAISVGLLTKPLSPAVLQSLKFPYGLFEIQDPVFTNNLRIKVPLLNDTITNVATLARPFKDVSKDILIENMPTILTQFGFTAAQIPDLIQKNAGPINDWVLSLLEDEEPSIKKRDIDERGLGDFFETLGCAAVAGAGMPVYLLAAANFKARNSKWEFISPQQQFFAFPVHGPLATSGPVHFYFKASRSAGFTSREVTGTTFNRDVYTYLANAPTADMPMFNFITTVLIHELTHVDQYRQQGYSLINYAYKFLFEACKVGGRLNEIPLEKSAKATETYVDGLLINPTGRWFFEIWRANGWVQNLLGYPIMRSFGDTGNPQVKFLNFERGVMEISLGGATPCFRTFTSAERDARNPTCQISPLTCRRSPMPPTEFDPENPPQPPREPTCDLEPIRKKNAACNKQKADAVTLNNRPFECKTNASGSARAPNCPPKCQIVSIALPGSKPCRELDAPDTCFQQEEVRKQNAACQKEYTRCGM